MPLCPTCATPEVQTKRASPQSWEQAATPKSTPAPLARSKRPSGMILLTALDMVGGAWWIFFGITFLWVPYGNSGWVIAFALAALSIVSGYGFFRTTSWSWNVGFVAGVGYLLIGLLYLANFSLVGTPIILFGAWTLYYLTRPGSKSYLGK